MTFWRYLKKTLDLWAKQSGFIQRKRQLSGFTFLVMMTGGLTGMKHPSLAGLVDAVKARMSRESLHLRFTFAAVVFMRKCVIAVLTQKIKSICSINASLLKHFSKIHIVDSSSWDIDPALKNIFPGSGGAASAANCKVQLCYEYLRGALSFFDVVPGKKSDSGYSSQLPELVGTNELLITDLGYFCLKTFYRIGQCGGFFLSRFLVGTSLFDPVTLAPINLSVLLKRAATDACELSVIMGADVKRKIACRLICLRVSEEVANRRRQRLLKNARKNNRTPSQQHLILADWTLMVTNVPQEWLPAGMARPFYCLRWQIELLFKQLKSVLCVDMSHTAKEPRLLCELLGRLIVAILIHRIHAQTNAAMWNTKRQEVSMEKIYKRFQERIFTIVNLIIKSVCAAANYIDEEINRLVKNCRKLNQKSRMSSLTFLEFGDCQKVKVISHVA